MTMKNVVAIVIVTHKSELNETEKISLDSLVNVFKGHRDIYVILPESVDGEIYTCIGIEVIKVEDIWLSSYRKYNEFCLQPHFYEHFVKYKYILLYQLDGFVFCDELDYFCNLEYDYIAAPWKYGNFWYKNQNETIWYVGCGGVSLRKVTSFIDFTNSEEIKKQSLYEPEDMVISSSRRKLKIAPLEIAEEFCITEYYDSMADRRPMMLHWFDHMDEKSFIDEIHRNGYNLPKTKYKDIIWDRDMHLEIVKFWTNEFSITNIANSIDLLSGRKVKHVYVWGTGNNSLFITKLLRDLDIEVIAYIDNDEDKRKKLYFEKKVMSIDDVVQRGELIFVSPTKSDEIEIQLNNSGYVKNRDYIIWRDFIKSSQLFRGGISCEV